MNTANILKRMGLVAVAGALAMGCGGSSGGPAAGGGGSSSGGGGGEAASGEGARPSGTEVSEAAQSRWSDAIAAFHTASAGGFTPDECSSVISGFEQANRTQGGRFTEAIYMVGVTHERCGNHEQALSFYRQALQLNDHFCGARVAEGLEHVQAGRTAQGRSEFERAIRDDATCTEGYVNLAILQRRERQYAEALENLRRALAIDSDSLPALNQIALSYYEQAARVVGAAQTAGGVAQAPAAGTEQERGRAAQLPAQARQALDLAEVVCRQAQLINGEYGPIYNTWGLVNVLQGNIIGGLAKFELAFRYEPRLFEAYMNFGELTLSFRGYEDAARAFERATELNPNSYDAWVGAGAARRGLNNDQGAQQAYERAQQIDPARPEAYFNLGLLYQDFRDGTEPTLTQARGYYDQFVQRAGSRPEYAAAVENVTRRCATDERSRRRRRWQRTQCQMGRLQQIESTISMMREAAQIQAQAAAIEAQAAQQAQQPPAPQ